MQSHSIATAARYLGQPADPLKLSVDQVKLQVEEIGTTLLSLQTTVNAVRTVTTAFEREFPDVLRQLDILAGQLDREKGDVAVLKEQLAFFANGGGRIRNDGATDASSSRGLYSFLLSIVMRYLYNPFLFFVHA
ncbi:GPI-anchored surface protein, putative [Bodo saltans]|uniref:GPI-anchored surface protein, putative n=1 Tax=Bodo saltans TaxID=75058 RepID=A0A0S4JAD1_BODSA|nr:GPI-anchored surface protein, putative [Bodo saltans]|eukprot:CUG86887.1 GPI-anchored surface protein, putative [Bodo saltans]